MAHAPQKPRPRYVLVIEDNVHHAELITEILDRHFAPVIIHTVDTVEDGLEFAKQSSYDLVITSGSQGDTPMPEMIPKLSQRARGIPIIVISGKGDEKLAAEFIKKGAAEYLSKKRETLGTLPVVLERHLAKSGTKKRRPQKERDGEPSGTPTATAILQEVDRLTQQTLAIAGPRRRKRRSPSQDAEQLNQLLCQIQRLRKLASKLGS